MTSYEKAQRGQFLDLTPEGHRQWMADHNPDDWNMRTWLAYNVRIGSDAAFTARAMNRARQRHAWVDEQVEKQIAGRRVNAGFIVELRRDLLLQAEGLHPRPNPFEDDWQMPEKADSIAALTNRMGPKQAARVYRRAGLEPPNHDDSKSLHAAREADSARPKDEAKGRRAWWS